MADEEDWLQAKFDAGASQAARMTPTAAPRVVQRIILPLGDLEDFTADWGGVFDPANVRKEQARREARVVDNAARWRAERTGEWIIKAPRGQADAKDDKPLAALPAEEELRIIGHGLVDEPGVKTSKFGGYTPAELAALLIRMGLGAEYKGTIYLAGCQSANVFLDEFAKKILETCPRVSVRGNTKNVIPLKGRDENVSLKSLSEEDRKVALEFVHDYNARMEHVSRNLGPCRAGLERNREIGDEFVQELSPQVARRNKLAGAIELAKEEKDEKKEAVLAQERSALIASIANRQRLLGIVVRQIEEGEAELIKLEAMQSKADAEFAKWYTDNVDEKATGAVVKAKRDFPSFFQSVAALFGSSAASPNT